MMETLYGSREHRERCDQTARLDDVCWVGPENRPVELVDGFKFKADIIKTLSDYPM